MDSLYKLSCQELYSIIQSLPPYLLTDVYAKENARLKKEIQLLSKYTPITNNYKPVECGGVISNNCIWVHEDLSIKHEYIGYKVVYKSFEATLTTDTWQEVFDIAQKLCPEDEDSTYISIDVYGDVLMLVFSNQARYFEYSNNISFASINDYNYFELHNLNVDVLYLDPEYNTLGDFGYRTTINGKLWADVHLAINVLYEQARYRGIFFTGFQTDNDIVKVHLSQ